MAAQRHELKSLDNKTKCRLLVFDDAGCYDVSVYRLFTKLGVNTRLQAKAACTFLSILLWR
ncbi:hypothetical protein HMPREF0476_1357 [Kingella kingae ATCC 23330]|uniref:Uncharacterized protein n=1 Tax=Kingella kingae ATCC 23330 TaxID=887327 RepID=F5S824_KINKI|nr:hypothetical protein HMPREF0476_1357 [Kingella kingae ATCC 23330]